MREYGFSLTRILPYKEKIRVSENPYSRIFYALYKLKALQVFSITKYYKGTLNSSQINYKHGQNIWTKVKKSSKIGQEQKTLITTSVGFLTAITKLLFLEKGLDTRLCLHPVLTFFCKYFLIS